MSYNKQLALFAAILAIICAVSNEDAKAQAREHLAYCGNVKDKIYPDYKGVYKQMCTATKLKEVEEILK